MTDEIFMRDDTKLTFNSRQINAAEKFFLDYVHSILGNSLKSVQFIREVRSLIGVGKID